MREIKKKKWFYTGTGDGSGSEKAKGIFLHKEFCPVNRENCYYTTLFNITNHTWNAT